MNLFCLAASSQYKNIKLDTFIYLGYEIKYGDIKMSMEKKKRTQLLMRFDVCREQ